MDNESYSRELIEFKIVELLKEIETLKSRIALERSLIKAQESKLEEFLLKYQEKLDDLLREKRVLEYKIVTAKNNYYSEKVRALTTRNKNKKKSRKPNRMRVTSQNYF